jgi:dihydroxyacetone kinase
MEELFILYDRFHDILQARSIFLDRTYVGEYATSMEMAGASLSLLRLTDEFTALLDAPAFSPFLPQWSAR